MTQITLENGLARDKHDGVNKVQYNYWPQIFAVLSASICFFNRGMHSAWTSPALPKLLNDEETINSYFPITANQGSWIVVSYSASICIGAPVSAYLINVIGRKNSILLTAVPHLISFLLIAFAKSVECIYVARILSGICEGLTNTVVPVYAAEVAQANIRGILGSATSVSIILGLLSVNIIGSYTTIFQSSMICSVFPLILIATFVWMPETPYYLMMKQKPEAARAALIQLRGTKEIDTELNSIKFAIDKQMKETGTFSDLFCIRNYRRSFFIALAMELIQQGSGINAIQSYTQIIFIESGESISAEMSSIILMLIQLITSIVAINFVDRLGRKPLLIFSCFGCSIALFFEGLYFYLQNQEYEYLEKIHWLPVTALIFYIVVYSSGLAIILNVLLGELFAANIKGKALGLTTIWYGFLAFIISRLFHIMIENYGFYFPFWIYAIFSIFGGLFIIVSVPETKGKTLDDIQEYLMKK